jgi:hypothetical protein
MSQIVARGQIPTAAADTVRNGTGLDDFSNIIAEKFGTADPAEIRAKTINAHPGVAFYTEDGTGSYTDCVQLEVNATHLRLSNSVAGAAGSVCEGVQALVDMGDIAVRGSRVTY